MFPDLNWANILLAMCPKAKANIVKGFAAAMPELIANYQIDTPLRMAHFLAQVCHESGGLRYTREIWGPTPAQVKYEGRKDLGNIGKGDGKKFMGRGLIQTTGRANYVKVGRALACDFVAHPEQLEDFPYAALSAGVFWRQNKLNGLADADDCRGCTKRINGGLNGFTDRQVYLARAKSFLVEHTQEVEEIANQDILPADKIKVLQAQLNSLGYFCTADGDIGAQTIGAIASFQHDNALPMTNKFDAATEQALYEAEKRPIGATRAEGLPTDSKIMNDAGALKKGAATIVGGIVVKAAADPVTTLIGVNEQFTKIQNAVAGFGLSAQTITDHWMILAGVLGVAVFAYARSIEKARIRDYQTGKTA